MAVTRRTVLKAAVAAGVGAVTGAGSYGFLYERHRLSVTRASLNVPGLPAALNGLRVALLTDVHHSRWVSAEDVRAAVDAITTERPDLIVLGGDYVTWRDRRFVEPVADAFRPLTAPCGVFAILGNHDDDHDMPTALARSGIQVLKDSRTHITVRGEGVDLIGIRFWTRRASDIARLMKGSAGMPVLLAHDPRRLAEATALDIPLVLAGHTHGGQVVLPVVGALAARKFPVAEGIAQSRQTTMFVSRGFGTIYVPVRINCPPEVAILTLT
jgi:uncharacterized protein